MKSRKIYISFFFEDSSGDNNVGKTLNFVLEKYDTKDFRSQLIQTL